jgi:DNA-binding NtrC family response regulator/class 3 adenylate cyclase
MFAARMSALQGGAARPDALGELLGTSPVIGAVRDQILRLAGRHQGRGHLPAVLIQGETGTGKGLVARLLHRTRPAPSGSFVEVNCAAIPEALLEAELFGYERGAFTDAHRAKVGLFQSAHQGTIFLDEVALLPEALQAKLLRVIEDRAVRRLGGTQPEPADAWVIAATNTDLPAAVRERRFREDLYHRLAVLTIRLPPLRERPGDVLVLAEALLDRACTEHGLGKKRLAEDARQRLVAHRWPGNVRELANVMERATLLVDGPTVTAAALDLESGDTVSPAASRSAAGPPVAEPATSLDEAMAEHLRATLERSGWNISRSAALLGISRNTLKARIERLGLTPGADATPARPRPRSTAPAPSSAARRSGGVAPRVPPAPVLRDAAPVAYTPPHLAERILTNRSALEGEHKRLTVLFGDLTDSSGLARRLGPEGMHGFLDQLFRVVLEEVHRYEGTVNQFLGDGFMALFGAPLAIEHHERQALLAATAIQRRLASELPDARGADGTSGFRMGLNTGTVVVGRIGDNLRMDYTAVGETTNIAARLQGLAEPGAILLSEATYERARGFADVDPLGPVALKGVPDVVAYRLTGLRPSRSTLQAVPDRPLSPFVGRDRDVAALEEALAHAEAGRGQVVGIVSEPGMGKSRLLLEFRQGLTGRRLTYLEGRCLPYGASIPYHPLLEILRTNCRIADADAPEVAASKIGEALAEVGMSVEDALPYLLHLVGLKEGSERLEALGPETVKARTFDALRQLCLRGSALRPIVFVVEDLHWVDRTSEEFLALMADSLPGARALLVGTYRHGYTPPWIGRSYATQLALRPLGEADSLGIVRAVLPDDSGAASVTGAIVSRGEGNPLFLEELARSMRDREDGQGELSIPDTVQGVLAARIDRLSEDAKRLLQLASVLGREFPARWLGALWDDPASLAVRLQDLTRLEFLYQRTWGDDPVYAFTHVLTRDAAYGSLLESRRREYHGAAGRALEETYEGRLGEAVELLAHHFGRSSVDEKAVDYAVRAAGKARRRSANAEALDYLESGLRHLARLPDTSANRLRRIDAILEQSEVRFALGQHAEQIQALEGIRAIVDESADPARLAAWHYWFGFLHSLTGSPPSLAIHHCQEALRIARMGGSTDIEAYVQSCLTQVSLFTGDLRSGLELGEQAVAAFEARGALWWAGRTLGHLSPIANALGEWARSLEYGHRALAHARTLDDRRLTIMATLRIASTLIQQGDPAGGLRCCDDAEALGPGPFDMATVRAIRGYGLVRAGDVPAGIALLKEVSAWLERSRLRYTQCQIAVWLAEAYLKAGTPEPARAVLAPALESAGALGYRYLEGVAHRLLGEALYPEPEAESHLDAALARLQEVDAQSELGRTWMAKASQARHQGRAKEAATLVSRATVVFERLASRNETEGVRSHPE